MSHANARLTPSGRLVLVLVLVLVLILVLVRRIAAGRPVAHVTAEMGESPRVRWRPGYVATAVSSAGSSGA